MLSDLLLVVIAASLISISIYGLKTKYQAWAAIALLTVSIPVIYTVYINLPNIFSPLTPVISGIVIDADTKKPLEGINIKAGWLVGGSSVGGGGGGYYKFHKTVTDAKGEFKLPRGMKTLTIHIPPFKPLVETRFIGINVVAYPNDYDYMVTTEQIKADNNVTITLNKVKSDADFLENIKLYWWWLSGIHKGNGNYITDQNELNWIRVAYYQFEKKYPNSKADEKVMTDLPYWLDSNKLPECVYVTERLLCKYPNSPNVWRARNILGVWKQKYKVK